MEETLRGAAVFDRALSVDDFALQRAEGESLRISFSAASAYPVERWYGTEVIDMSPGAMRSERLDRGAVPLLFNHDMNDPVGMVERASLRGGKLQVDARFFPGDERVERLVNMVEHGMRNVSIRYRVHSVEEVKSGDNAGTTYIRDWEMLEASLVTIPADPTVGVGRSASDQEFDVRMVRAAIPAATPATEEVREMSQEAQTASASVTAENVPQPQGEQMESARIRAIDNICKANKIDEKVRHMWVGQGLSIEQVSDDLLKLLQKRGETNPQSVAKIGLTDGETKRYSIVRAIEACAAQNWKNAGFELECSRAIQQKLNVVPDPNTFHVPFEFLHRGEAQRDLTAASAGAGGYLVETQNVGFIDILRNRSVCYRMGAMRLPGLVGNVTVPRQSVAATAYWLANEGTQITESQQTFVQMALTPKSVGAYTEISRQLLLQSSPAIEGIVSNDLAAQVALAVDLAGLEGSGASGQPTGISQTAGIGGVTGTSIAYAGILEFQTDVAGSNVVPVRGGYVTTPAVASLLMQRVKFTSTASPLWEGNIWEGNMTGFPAMSSNQPTAATMVFGDWNEMVIAEWGVLAVEVNPFANFQAGIIGVRAMYSIDIGIRRPFAFSRATSIT
jgi:HK97 family phage major capsid protein